MKTIKIYNTLEVTIQTDVDYWTEAAENYSNEIFEAIEKEDINLAEYADNDKVKSITMSVEFYGNKLYGVATCEVTDDFEDIEWLKNYLTGQYSDGWGEGFEQREISEWIGEEESEEYDEDEGYYTDYYDVRYSAYVNFWQYKNFRIMTEDELKK